MLIKKLKIVINQEVLLADSQSVSKRRRYSICANHLLDLILTIVILYMINQKTKIFKIRKKLNWCNTRNINVKIYNELGLHLLGKRRWCSNFSL